MEEAGSKVTHRRKKGDRNPGIMHCDLAAFEASADGHKYCLVAAVTIEVNHESKLLPFFVPMPKKDAVCAVAALKEALTMCDNRNLHQIMGSRIVRIQADEMVSSPTRKFEIYVGKRTLHCPTLQLISHLPMV